MKFTILSHAGLLVETGAGSIVCDPWLVGSCYWRSWWNYPPPPRELVRGLRPDFVYLSHLHWDHFHAPSLKRFDRATPILVPKAHFPRMVDDLADCGFRNVVELPHGKPHRLGPETVVTCWQFGLALDSALVVEDRGTVLLNANDCKLMGAPLRHLTRRHPRVDFVLRSHSSASPFPHCIETDDPALKSVRASSDYCEEFLRFAMRVGARHAIPFASNHCFLHRETRRFNATVTSPLDVEAHVRAHAPPGLTCQVMVPGDSWSEQEGFRIQEQDWLTRREAHVEELARQHAGKLEETYRREERARPDRRSFERYFQRFLDDLPWVARRAFPLRVLFEAEGSQPATFLVDIPRRRVETVDGDVPDHDFALVVPTAVLNDCVRKRMFSVFTASKRLRFVVRRGGLRQLAGFATLLDLHESDYFPLRTWARRRFLACWIRRWREAFFYLGLLGRVALRRPLRPADLI